MVSSNLKRGRVKDSSEDELHLVDAVLSAFSLQREEYKLPPQLKVHAVYRAFEELRGKYLTWLQDMRFTYGPAGTVPISGALEDILFNLGASGIMAVENPRYEYLQITAPKLEVIRKAIYRRRNKTQRTELERLADEFSKLYSKAAKKE